MKTIFIILLSCVVLASCSDPLKVNPDIEKKPTDLTQHKFIDATKLQITAWSDDDDPDPKDPVFISRGILQQDSVQIDTTYSSPFLKLRVKRDFYPRPLLTDRKFQIRSIEFYVKAIEVNGNPVPLTSFTSGFGARIEAAIPNQRGGGYHDTTFVTDNITVGSAMANKTLDLRTFVCNARIQIPYDERVTDSNHNIIHVTYQVTY